MLEDLWELGSSPHDILELITRHLHVSEQTWVLDLACGKGAVSVHLARELGCKVKGIDLISEFIDFAVQKAQEFGVGDLCEFVVGDITESVKMEKDFDLVIYGAVGDVLGDWRAIITQLKKTVKKGGYIIIDDAYGYDQSDAKYLTREQWLDLFCETGVKLIDEKIFSDDKLAKLTVAQQSLIVKRVNELKQQVPEKADLFDSYIQSQQAEWDELRNDISGVTLLLQAIEETGNHH